MITNVRSLSSCLPTLLAAGILVALHAPALAQQASTPAQVVLSVPAQPLDRALIRLADQAGIRILFVSSEVAPVQAPDVSGIRSVGQALDQLLAGTGLAWHWREPGIAVVAATPAGPTQAQAGTSGDTLMTGTLNVAGASPEAGGAERDRRGHDAVYDLDISTSYIGRTEVERYKGATPSDLVNGVPGVFSGDARNSGALDLNIRGIQGRGRVPVTIDGTEQALTVWRGYNGATNRNYIDPFLIGGIQIIKGPALVRDVNTGIGGAMVVRTLDVDDIVTAERGFGGEFRLEGSSNATRPRLPTLHTGEDYRNVEGYPQSSGITPNEDMTLRVQPRSGGGGYNVFNGEDYAWRLALGWKSDDVDLLAAYAYRERGNYYAGRHNAGYYSHAQSSWADDVISWMARYFEPGNEMTNTSSQMESWLFKVTWRPTDDQTLTAGYRDSLSHYGEIMPSRVFAVEPDGRGSIQWPLSRVDSKAWNLEYSWAPADSRWLDLRANIWRTQTLSDTYSAGGFPNYASGVGNNDVILRNTAIANATNTRNGVTLSNRFRFTDVLGLTVGGDFQREKLRSGDVVAANDGWRSYPRAGRRQEWNASLNLDWQPTDWLRLDVGGRYMSYWAFDDYVAANPGRFNNSATVSRQATYWTGTVESNRDEIAQIVEEVIAQREDWESQGYNIDDLIQELWDSVYEQTTRENHTLPWAPDANGKYSAATNPCLNGAFIKDAQQYMGDGAMLLSANGDPAATYCSTAAINQHVTATAEKKRGHRWVPAFGATVNFSDYTRAYVRHTQALRYPSLFESTIGFSANINPFRDLKPEHAYNWEVALIHDFSHLLDGDKLADVKLAYYRNKTRNVIERDNRLSFANIDKQTIQGLELAARYDGGRLFTDVAMNYMLDNEVCDASHALLTSIPNGEHVNAEGVSSDIFLPGCVKYGFLQGYLLTQATPEFSANWSLGGRFLEQRLEVGGRLTYYNRYRNADLDFYRDNTVENGGGFIATSNYPYSWGETLLLDAYVSYRMRDNLDVELTGTNLTDQYYIDPSTRAMVAAPGRTFKLSVTARF